MKKGGEWQKREEEKRQDEGRIEEEEGRSVLRSYCFDSYIVLI